jgi:hypothetical protein
VNVTEVVVAVAVLVGLVGIVVPFLPGTLLILGAVLVWAVETGTRTGWVVFALVTTLLVLGTVAKYVVPHRGMRTTGVPSRTVLAGGLLGIVGFFVIPVVGLFVGFVLGVYLAELRRVGHAAAGPSTRSALKAIGISVLVELAAGLLAAATWLVGVLAW